MSEDAKGEIIEKACKEFFGSITDTFKEAKKLDKSIKLEDVKKWFNQKFARKTRPIQNSYVANYAYQEYQMDLFSCQTVTVKTTTPGCCSLTSSPNSQPSSPSRPSKLMISWKPSSKASRTWASFPRCSTRMTKVPSTQNKRCNTTATTR